MAKLLVTIIGAARGNFTNDEKENVEYGSAYVTEELRPDEARKYDAVGVMVIKYGLTPEAFNGIKGCKLPADFQCDIQQSQSATGIKLKLISAKCLTPQATK